MTRRRPSRDCCVVVGVPLTARVGCVHKIGFFAHLVRSTNCCVPKGLQSTDANIWICWNAMYRPEHVDGKQASPQGVRLIRNIQQLVPGMHPIDMHWDCFRIVLVLDWLSPTIRPRCGQFNVIIVCCRLLCTVPCWLLDWLILRAFPFKLL